MNQHYQKSRNYLLIFLLSSFSWAAPKAEVKPVKGDEETVVNAALVGMQKFWDETKTYKATFKQVVFAKRLGTRDETAGTLYVMKPGKLRWESKADNSFQLMNGNTLTYVHSNKRRGTTIVDILDNANKTIDAKALQFLAGKANFKENYSAKLVKDGPKTIELKLTPKEGSSETYIAESDKGSYGIRSLTTESVDTRARIEFAEIQTNLKLEEKLFKYEPKPTDVVHREK